MAVKNNFSYFFLFRAAPEAYEGSQARGLIRAAAVGAWKFAYLLWVVYLSIFRAASVAYGSSQTRGRIGATAASLGHSHSNARSKLHLEPTQQLVAMPDP